MNLVQIIFPIFSSNSSQFLGFIPKNHPAYIMTIITCVIFSVLIQETFTVSDFDYKSLEEKKSVSNKQKAFILLEYFIGKVCLFI